MAKIYTVVLPITGVITVEVESDVKLSDKEAIDKALASEYSIEDIQEWEALKRIVQGNVFYGNQNEAEVVDVDDDNETDDGDADDLDDD